jgi:uncharacterized membrane protein YphA (DoxX/SURF4 family)
MVAVNVLAGLVADVYFLSAGWKLLHRKQFLFAAEGYSTLGWLPRSRRASVLSLVAPLELVLGALLLWPRGRAIAGFVAAGAFVLFAAIIGNDRRRFIASCGCWGSSEIPTPRIAYVARNATLTLVCVVVAVVSILAGNVDSSVGAAAIGAAMMLPLAALVLEIPDLSQVWRLGPRA